MHLSPAAPDTSDEQRIEDAARGLLSGIGRLTRSLFKAGDYGLTRSEVSVLDSLDAAPLRVTAVAARTGMVQPRVTMLLKKLEEAGLVERHRCTDDRRAVETTLTPAGRQLLERGRQRMAVALREALDSTIDDSERAVSDAREAVVKLANAMESEVS
ncbi:MarR family winged helix-turn-helix transcriptional regulator [Streptomyces sp. NPDC090306]|uniref:MarR family winged helix-turn-helix transcriptional regulator n=1 Tax=unclassified Streptomyces TaxID=2593676 RepID=UPI0036E2C68C